MAGPRTTRSPERPSLTVGFEGGANATLLVRALQIAVERAPPDVELLVVARADRAHGRRLFRDMPQVRYVALPDDAGQHATTRALLAAARSSYLLLVPAQCLPAAATGEQALRISREPDAASRVVVGLTILANGDVASDDSTGRRPLSAFGATRDPLASRQQVRRAVDAVGHAAVLVPVALLRAAVDASESDPLALLAASTVEIVSDPRLAVIDLASVAKAAPRRAVINAVPTPPKQSLSVLVLEDRVPHPWVGSGYPRSHAIVESLRQLGHCVVLYPMHEHGESLPCAYADMPRSIEIVLGLGASRLGDYLRAEAHRFDLVYVSRPHNMEVLRDVVAARPAGSPRLPPFAYDAEALFSLRDAAQRAHEGRPLDDSEMRAAVDAEVALADGAAVVVTVSERERDQFARRHATRVVVLSHGLAACPTPRAFAERRGLLFVGALKAPDSPNVAALRWFIADVLPRLAASGEGAGPLLRVAGETFDAFVGECGSPQVEFLGRVDDLQPLYDAAQAFVAPALFSAGIPLKIIEAAAHGLPVVATPQLAAQLAWRDGSELLTGDTPNAFATACRVLCGDEAKWTAVRDAALRRVAADASPTVFTQRVAHIVELATGRRAAT